MRLIDRPSLTFVVALLLTALMSLSGLMLAASPLRAQTVDLGEDAKYAAIVVDAASGEVLYARRADSPRYPASITKVMTLYMAFEALAQGTLSPDDIVTVSANAQAQSPMKLGLGTGATLTVDEAMKAIAVYSANDIAVALAEKIGGTEQRFSALMTLKAQELGMSQTRFVNASGLPNSRQLSSARDIAILARAVMRDYPQYYEYFNVRHWVFRGRTYVNHNPLLAIPGVDGMKTGFTNASGYNLAASMVRDNHRLIVIMLGGRNKEQRREHVAALLNTGFDVINRRQRGEQIAVAQTRIEQAVLRRTPVDTASASTSWR
ncbi:MAG: D-alanyl-D-alanine carboxypeptidase family protein [Asticcacaulis sp.]